MHVSHLPVPLMNAAERHGFRAAIALFRADAEGYLSGARALYIETIGIDLAKLDEAAQDRVIAQRGKGDILNLIGQSIIASVQKAEAQLPPMLGNDRGLKTILN